MRARMLICHSACHGPRVCVVSLRDCLCSRYIMRMRLHVKPPVSNHVIMCACYFLDGYGSWLNPSVMYCGELESGLVLDGFVVVWEIKKYWVYPMWIRKPNSHVPWWQILLVVLEKYGQMIVSCSVEKLLFY